MEVSGSRKYVRATIIKKGDQKERLHVVHDWKHHREQ